MDFRNVHLLVDNREKQSLSSDLDKTQQNYYRTSAFKAINMDVGNQSKQNDFQESNKLFDLEKRIEILEKKLQRFSQSSQIKVVKKRNRRKIIQINRKFKCSEKNCQRVYGSETSLKNHLRLKHGLKI